MALEFAWSWYVAQPPRFVAACLLVSAAAALPSPTAAQPFPHPYLQIDAYLEARGLKRQMVGAYRVTDHTALQGAVEAAGTTCTEVAALLSKVGHQAEQEDQP